LGGNIRLNHVKALLKEKALDMQRAQIDSISIQQRHSAICVSTGVPRREQIAELTNQQTAVYLRQLNLPIKNTKSKMHRVLYDYLDNQRQVNVAEIPQQQQAVGAFSKALTKEQVDGLSKLQATEFLRHLNLSINDTKLKMRHVLHDFFVQKPSGYKVVM
jgi:hypothetical protein